jgi:hypothetical protein
MIRFRLRYLAAALLISPVVGPTDSLLAQGWPPDSIKNLQVLPEDIEFRELVGTMRSFAISLGVRCSYCHVRGESPGLASMDFASDEKVSKQKARAMLQMVRRINDELLAEIPHRHEPGVEVTCFTCHRGLHHPTTIQGVLTEQLASGGAVAVIEEYEKLREEYYGAGVYDFSEGVLPTLAEQTAVEYPDETLVYLEHNFTYFPESVATHVAKAQVFANAKGDFGAAIASMRAAQELQPDQPRFQQMIDQMQAAMENQEE